LGFEGIRVGEAVVSLGGGSWVAATVAVTGAEALLAKFMGMIIFMAGMVSVTTGIELAGATPPAVELAETAETVEALAS
jgi:hypothetical protein